MSGDLLIYDADVSGFSADACLRYLRRFGIKVEFPDGIDLEQFGFVPCVVNGAGTDGRVETGFELFSDLDEGALTFTVPSDEDGVAWPLAYAIGAYCVAELGGNLNDPQEGLEYGPDSVDALVLKVKRLFGIDEVKRSGKAKKSVDRIVHEAAAEVLEGSGFVSNGRSWYEDHGWFVIGIGFQKPRGWSGTFQGVFVRMFSSPGMAMDYGERIGRDQSEDLVSRADAGEGLEFRGDVEQFRADMLVFAQRGLERAVQLRRLDDWYVAKTTLFGDPEFAHDGFWGYWRCALLCYLTGDPQAPGLLQQFFDDDWGGYMDDEVKEFQAEQRRVFEPIMYDFAAVQERIADLMVANRARARDELPALDPQWRLVVPAAGTVPEVPVRREVPKRSVWKRLFGAK